MKKIFWTMAAATCIAAAAVGCGKASTGKDSVAESAVESTVAVEEDSVANPWHESDKEGVLEATGIELITPDDAEYATYSYLDTENLAQVSYVRGTQNWVYRAVASDVYDDISGLYYDWASEESVEVSGRHADLCSYSDDNETIWVINWYDEVPGIMYSLSVTAGSAEDLDGLDMQGMAEALFIPMQDDTDDDVSGDGVEDGTAAAAEEVAVEAAVETETEPATEVVVEEESTEAN